jgi:16S rRNA U516 pseudouridylate synthase RsuA-like enzyme
MLVYPSTDKVTFGAANQVLALAPSEVPVVYYIDKPPRTTCNLTQPENYIALACQKLGQDFFHVGQLDADTTGLLLLTNCGNLAR